MKSRSNSSQPLFYHSYPIRNNADTHPRRPVRSKRPSHPISFDAEVGPPQPQIQLEDEISMAELTRFVMECVEKLATAKDQPVEGLIKTALAEKLPSYNVLKGELLQTRQSFRSHHAWAKQMVATIEPLLKNNTAPASEQEKLSELAVKCVEQSMQLQARAKQLKRRLEFLEEAVSQHLVNVGTECGFPGPLMQRLADLTRKVLQQSQLS